MSRSGLRRITGRVLMGVGVLALFGFGGCAPGFKDAPPVGPPDDPPPKWSDLTLFFSDQQIGNPATGWVTTVTLPTCTDAGLPVTLTASVSNGSVVDNGNGTYSWTRAVTGAPATRVPGTFTANCEDKAGQLAHPTLAVTDSD